ncbi:mitochondrial splicing system protein [Entomophthora muscae]|uniref:Mitochondrial splicing system protein n=1 Tax=Entomophthora muscae TaxID=34485 RepID=A0ACC2T5K2_9FUNG|nr:mitochondrial splicing system protein [Entomophthora muscae]
MTLTTSVKASHIEFSDKFSPGKLYLRKIIHPITKELLDVGLVVWFQAPRSFTGEDVVELHLHGSLAVLRGTLEALDSLNKQHSHTIFEDRTAHVLFRLAHAGEFTRRAFENGKFDLTAVEGLADLLNAETGAQRRLALRHTQGEVGDLYVKWRKELISARARIEAVIDFGDDEEVDPKALEQAIHNVSKIVSDLSRHMSDARRGEVLMSGIKVALLGAPNAGKSSLLNRMSVILLLFPPLPGTTRDVVTGKIDLGGMPLVLLDTAGIHDASNDLIEKEGIRRSLALGEQVDVRVLVLDGILLSSTQELPSDLLPLLSSGDSLLVIAVNKCENLSQAQVQAIQSLLPREASVCSFISCLSGKGLEEFICDLTKELSARFESPCEEPAAITQARHRHHLQETSRQLGIFMDIMVSGHGGDLVLAAEHLRIAALSLGRITGHIDVEEVLDALFREFCIGK